LIELIKVLGEEFFENGLGNNWIHGLGKSFKIPLDNLRLPSVTVSLMFVGSIRNIVFGEIVNESKGSKVDSLINHTHVISIEYAMNETVSLPVGN
jgi:hypothetical protein